MRFVAFADPLSRFLLTLKYQFMKKFLLSMAALATMAFTSYADTATFDFTTNSYGMTEFTTGSNFETTVKSFSEGNVTIDMTGSYRMWSATAGKTFRMGANAVMTISVPDGYAIQSVDCTGSNQGSSNISVTGGTLSGTASAAKITANANTSSITVTRKSGTVQFKTLKVTYASAGATVVAAPTFTPAPGYYETAQEVAIASEGNTIYYTLDGTDPDDGSTKYTAAIPVDKNTTIKAIAYDADDNKSQIITAVYTFAIPGGEGDGTEANPYNAIAATNAAVSGSTASVYVKGIISEIKSVDTGTYGNAEYYISADGTTENQFYIFRGYYLDGAKFTSADQIKVGDNVVVYGKLTYYQGTPELNSGNKIVNLNGETPQPDPELPDASGTGTEDDPYNCSAVIGLNPTATTPGADDPEVWVQGYIVGYFNSNATTGSVFNADAAVASNFLIAPTADCTNYKWCVSVQLPSGSAVRKALNLLDHPDYLGKLVAVKGQVCVYAGIPGLKNTNAYKTIGWSGIEGVEIDENAPVEYFNLQGVRVNNPENGLFIMRQGNKVTKVIK